MGFPDLFKLEKLKILAYSDVKRKTEIDGSPYEAMFNPQTLTRTSTNIFTPAKGAGSGMQSATFVRTAFAFNRIRIILASCLARAKSMSCRAASPSAQSSAASLQSGRASVTRT